MRTAFLSSTGRDLREYREAAYGAFDGLDGWHCVRMEDFGARDSDPLSFCREKVRECDLFIGIVGHYYGSCPPGSDVSFTVAEYETAVDAGKPRLMFVAPDDFPIPANLRKDEDSHRRQQEFRSEVLDERVVASFDAPDRLAISVTQAIHNWERLRWLGVDDYDVGPTSGADGPAAPAANDVSSLPSTDTKTVLPVQGLAAALRMRRLARGGPEEFAAIFPALSAIAGPARQGFWFLQSALDAKWLPVLSALLRRELHDRPNELLWPVARMLVRVAEQDPEAVVDSGLLPVLWSGGDEGHLWHALSVIEAGTLWEHEAVVPLLTEVPTAWPQGLGQIAFQLASWGKQSDSAATFALRWIAQWLKVAPERDVERGALRLSVPFALGELAQALPDAVLQSAIPLLDAALLRQDPEDVVLRLRYHFGDDMRGEAPVLQVRRVLADKLADASQRPKVLNILAELLGSDNAAKRAVALDVASEDPVECKQLVVEAAHDPRNFGYRLSDWMDYLIHKAYADLTDEDKRSVAQALLALPDEAPDEGTKGYIKLHALAAIPEDLRRDELQQAIADLRRQYPDFGDAPYEPGKPGGEISGGAYTVGEEPDTDLISPTENPVAAIDQQVAAWDKTEEAAQKGWSSPAAYALQGQLERAPEGIEPLAHALAERALDLPDSLLATLVSSIASAIRTSKDVGGQTAYRVASTLRDALTSEARQDLSAVLAERWDEVAQEDRVAVVELLANWLRDEPKPTAEDTERHLKDREPAQAANVGLNTPRGGIAVALVDVAAGMDGDVPKAALEAITAAADDPSPFVRAIVAVWVRKLGRKAEPSWLVEVAQRCIADFSPYVLPSITSVFRWLEAEEIEEFGANVVRLMLASGEDAAKGAGFLAAIWSLRYPSEVTIALVDEVLASDSAAAKSEAAHVFAYNVLDEDQTTSDECMRRCQVIAAEQPAEVQKSLYRNLPRPAGLPSRLDELLRTAALDADGAGFQELHHRLHMHVRKEEEPNPDAVKVIVQGLLDNPNKELLGSYLRQSFYLLGDVFDTLCEQDERKLALRLLDAACCHCVPAAADLLDKGEALLREMGELPDGE